MEGLSMKWIHVLVEIPTFDQSSFWRAAELQTVTRRKKQMMKNLSI